jgi:Dolichyl-phosphate-mannose-protein mannosyltransferase
MKLNKCDILICTIFVIILGLNIFPQLSNRLLTYDEADYAVATSQGIISNYLDKNTTPFLSFVKQGLSSFLFGKQEEIAKEVRDKKDVLFYRHFDPPLIVYIARIFTIIGGEKEFFFRLGSALFILLLIPLVYFLLLFMFPQYGRLPSILSSFLVSFSPVLRQVGILLCTYSIYTFFAMASLFSIVAFLKTSKKKFLYLNGILIGLGFLTHEYTWIIVLTFLLSLILLDRKYLRIDKKGFYFSWQIFLSLVITFGVFFILYPAGIIRLGVLKEYMFRIYSALTKGEAWKSGHTLTAFLSLLYNFPVDSIIILFAFFTGLYFLLRRNININLSPFFIYTGFFLVIYSLKAPAGIVYFASIYPPLYLIASVVLTEFYKKTNKKVGIPLLIIALAILFISNFMYLRKPVDSNDFIKPAIEYLQNNAPQKDKILVSFGYMPTISYYLPHLDVDMIHLSDDPEYLTSKLSKEFEFFVFVGNEDSLKKTALNSVLQSKFTIVQKYSNDKNNVMIFRKTNE